MKKVKVGVLGCGTISDWHLSGWKDVSGGEVVAVCDIVEEKAIAMAGKYNVARIFTDYQQMLEKGDIDAVDICLPHYLHSEAVIAAARAGKHALVEKPMTNTLEEADRMIRECDIAGVKLMVAHIARFGPVSQIMKKVIDSGTIGKLHTILHRSMMHKDVVAQSAEEQSEWKLREGTSGGGCLHRCGIHSMDLIRWLSGSEVTRIYAETGTFVWDVPYETASHVSMRFANGAIGVYDHTWFYVPGYRASEMVIIGSEGAARERTSGPAYNSRAEVEISSRNLDAMLSNIPDLSGLLPLHTGKKRLWGVSDEPIRSLHFQLPVGSSFAVQESHFVDCILNDRQPLITGVDGARALEMVIAAYRSAASHEPQTLPILSL
ncbi:MAG: Gfo/Idh/MocA family oxidoreductase [Dehalococcoidales bacterium]|nr:Gfo/Idh/MocA family oxidoreductase [Dehalococcoidales bacterium]